MSDDDQQTEDEQRCGCRRRLTAGWYLCDPCSTKLSDDLLECADRYHKLSAAPTMQPGRYDRSGANKPGSKPPLNLNVVAMRDPRSGQREPAVWKARDGKVHVEPENDTPSVLRELAQWVGALVTHLGYEHLPAANVDDVVAWLNRQSEQIARWHEAPGLAKGARLLRNRLRSATGDANDRPIGPCMVDIVRNGEHTTCGAPVFLPEPKRGVSPTVWCRNRDHPHEYDLHALNKLKLELEQAAAQKNGPEEAAT